MSSSAPSPHGDADRWGAVPLPPRRWKEHVRDAAMGLVGTVMGDRVGKQASIRRVQVLCLHHVAREQLVVLERLIAWVRQFGEFEALGSAMAKWSAGKGTRVGAARPVFCLTFDDGFAHHEAVGSWLSQWGVSATFFVCSDALGMHEEAARRFCAERLGIPPLPLMGWDGAGRLIEMGHEMGCHTADHPSLRECSAAELDRQIAAARAALIEKLGKSSRDGASDFPCFAWPFGRWERFSREARAAVHRAGFTWCVSAEPGAHGALAKAVEPHDVCVRRLSVDLRVGVAGIRTDIHRLAGRGGNFGWPIDY